MSAGLFYADRRLPNIVDLLIGNSYRPRMHGSNLQLSSQEANVTIAIYELLVVIVFVTLGAAMSHKHRVLEMTSGGELFRSRDFDEAGIPRVVLKRMVADGELEQIQRGVYRNPVAEVETDETRLKSAEIAKRHPAGVLCLMSAFRFHGLTDDMHSQWTVAVQRTSPVTTASWLKAVRWSDPSFYAVGVENHVIAGADVRVTSPARTVADAMRKVHGVSDEVALKAFSAFLRQGGEPEDVGRIARELGFARDLGRMVPFARHMVSEGVFQEADMDMFRF